MTALFSACLLAFAVSVDSFGVGFAYGLRRLKLPVTSLLFISMCSIASVLLGSLAAIAFSGYVPEKFTDSIGGVILILIGIWTLIHVIKENNMTTVESSLDKEGMFSQVWGILKTPENADMDKSGIITTKEALFLGMALSFDAFGAGIGASLLELPIFTLAAAIAVMCAVFLTAGMKCGRKLSEYALVQKLSYVPGVLLILLGIWNLL
ncbi:sporulation membrane protein YtaF [Bacillus piscicola]|uniref:sporulation membrane protein YtaF n=1 Tax=Bacillus piscicola TaxID=1632684 RepID=UPI001F09D120|nr:sporulation membrane protein YtaF [Bacillus piscicola]